MSNDDSIEQKSWAIPSFLLGANAFLERYPRGHLCAALVLMLPGYFFLFLFPYLVFESAHALFVELPAIKTSEDWLIVKIWLVILLLGIFFSQKIFRLHFPRVQGLKISEELAPALYSLIAEVHQLTERPRIRNVVLTDQYELRIEATPRFGFPLLMSNTLVVGMPMLQTLSETQFRGAVMYKLGQYASGRFRPTHWVYRTRLLWCRYYDALQKRRRMSEMPLRYFFSFYAPLFARFTVPVVRRDELVADGAVLEWLNDRDYFETVKSSAIAEVFLESCFWQKVYQLLRKNPQIKKDTLNPFAELEQISGHLKSKAFRQKCLQKAFSADQDFSKTSPVLCARMDNIGQSKLHDVPIVEKTAAAACLGNARKDYVLIIDKLWRLTTFATWKADDEKRRADIKTVKELSRKSQQHILGIKEMLCYAQIAKRLRGDSLRQSLRKILKRNLRNLWPVSLRRKSEV